MTQPERGMFPDALDLQIAAFDEYRLAHKAMKEARQAHYEAIARHNAAKAKWDKVRPDKPGVPHADV